MSIKKLSERDHLLLRPAMYIGSIDKTISNEYILEDNKIQYKEVQYIPGLIKVTNELIDNSVDVAIKSNFKSANIIEVKMTDKMISVKDNGSGIPIIKNSDGHWLPELAWGHARAGSNFEDDINRTQIGMNGVGSFATNCFSTKFIGETETADCKEKYKITFQDNASKFTEVFKPKTGTPGTTVSFYPDLKRFGIDSLDDNHMNIIKQRLINLSMSFPEITFKFNGRKINVSSFKKYISLFNTDAEIIETDNYRFAILPNEADDFRQFSYVNGLKIPDGGTHIDLITTSIVNPIRTKLQKKFKSIKPGDIKNKLMIVMFGKNLKNPKFNSQTKEKITNSMQDIIKYYGDIEWDKITNKLLRNKAIIDPITEVYRIKEEFKKRQELKSLNKTVKRIKSDKYYPSIGTKKYLLVVEGESALGGLMPVLGRKECGFYTLKGKPLNSYSALQAKFTANKELSELYKIIQNENYTNIIWATDQDLDGIHIRGLLTGFIQRYLPEYKNNIGMLQTPVIGIKKNNKLQSWHYSLKDKVVLSSGEISKYYKGLGSWKESDLKHIVQIDGLSKMIDMIEFDDEKMLEDWLGTDSAPRKEYIINNNFNIAKL